MRATPRSCCVLAVAAVGLACAGAPTPRTAAPGAVSVWVTTGDRAKLLERQSDVSLTTDVAPASATIDVDASRQFQAMVGFGAAITGASAWLIQTKLTAAQREALLADLFDRERGLGLSFTRLPMGASDFSRSHYSYDDVPPGETDPGLARFSIDRDRAEILPVVRRALAINPQLAVMASPWSAPGWMKTTGSLIKGTLRPEAYDAFARYFVRFVRGYAAEGVPIYAVTVQNEPHFEPESYPCMRLDPAARAAFVGEHLGPLFAREGVRTLILEWDHNWDQPTSPMTVLASPSARAHIAGVAWHCYAGEVSAQSVVRDAFPDKDVYFTECSGGEWAPRFADNLLWTTRTLIVGATRHWARGVLLWNLALDEQHGPHTGGCADCRGVVTINSATGAVTRNEEYYALGHASKFVRPGARRVWSSSAADLETVAFANGDGSMVLIAVNTASAGRDFVVRTGTGRAFAYALPAGAVATFRWK